MFVDRKHPRNLSILTVCRLVCCVLLYTTGFWTNDRIKAFLSDVPNDKMIILDLNSEQSPKWSSTESYFGKPFIWCLLHNYGGTRGIYGNLTTIATGPIDALNTPGSTMIGVGITPEAIEHNPIVYDLMVSRCNTQMSQIDHVNGLYCV